MEAAAGEAASAVRTHNLPARARASPALPWNRNSATALISLGFWRARPQHDPPQQPQRRRWRNGTERGKERRYGLGDHVRDAEPRPGGDPAAHHDGVLSGVRGVLALADGLVSWGSDDVIRRWSPDGAPRGPAWIAPAPLDTVTKVDDDLWVGMLGRPHRLLLD
jgi:hypothetical protein